MAVGSWRKQPPEKGNRRGRCLILTSVALRDAGLDAEARAVETVGKRENWSSYATALIKTAIGVAENNGVLDKLHVLLYCMCALVCATLSESMRNGRRERGGFGHQPTSLRSSSVLLYLRASIAFTARAAASRTGY
jgi:hypothetical protein